MCLTTSRPAHRWGALSALAQLSWFPAQPNRCCASRAALHTNVCSSPLPLCSSCTPRATAHRTPPPSRAAQTAACWWRLAQTSGPTSTKCVACCGQLQCAGTALILLAGSYWLGIGWALLAGWVAVPFGPTHPRIAIHAQFLAIAGGASTGAGQRCMMGNMRPCVAWLLCKLLAAVHSQACCPLLHQAGGSDGHAPFSQVHHRCDAEGCALLLLLECPWPDQGGRLAVLGACTCVHRTAPSVAIDVPTAPTHPPSPPLPPCPGHAWITDYGDPDKAEDFAYILRYRWGGGRGVGMDVYVHSGSKISVVAATTRTPGAGCAARRSQAPPQPTPSTLVSIPLPCSPIHNVAPPADGGQYPVRAVDRAGGLPAAAAANHCIADMAGCYIGTLLLRRCRPPHPAGLHDHHWRPRRPRGAAALAQADRHAAARAGR